MSVLMQAWVLETKVEHCVQLFLMLSFCVSEKHFAAVLQSFGFPALIYMKSQELIEIAA